MKAWKWLRSRMGIKEPTQDASGMGGEDEVRLPQKSWSFRHPRRPQTYPGLPYNNGGKRGVPPESEIVLESPPLSRTRANSTLAYDNDVESIEKQQDTTNAEPVLEGRFNWAGNVDPTGDDFIDELGYFDRVSNSKVRLGHGISTPNLSAGRNRQTGGRGRGNGDFLRIRAKLDIEQHLSSLLDLAGRGRYGGGGSERHVTDLLDIDCPDFSYDRSASFGARNKNRARKHKLKHSQTLGKQSVDQSQTRSNIELSIGRSNAKQLQERSRSVEDQLEDDGCFMKRVTELNSEEEDNRSEEQPMEVDDYLSAVNELSEHAIANIAHFVPTLNEGSEENVLDNIAKDLPFIDQYDGSNDVSPQDSFDPEHSGIASGFQKEEFDEFITYCDSIGIKKSASDEYTLDTVVENDNSPHHDEVAIEQLNDSSSGEVEKCGEDLTEESRAYTVSVGSNLDDLQAVVEIDNSPHYDEVAVEQLNDSFPEVLEDCGDDHSEEPPSDTLSDGSNASPQDSFHPEQSDIASGSQKEEFDEFITYCNSIGIEKSASDVYTLDTVVENYTSPHYDEVAIEQLDDSFPEVVEDCVQDLTEKPPSDTLFPEVVDHCVEELTEKPSSDTVFDESTDASPQDSFDPEQSDIASGSQKEEFDEFITYCDSKNESDEYTLDTVVENDTSPHYDEVAIEQHNDSFPEVVEHCTEELTQEPPSDTFPFMADRPVAAHPGRPAAHRRHSLVEEPTSASASDLQSLYSEDEWVIVEHQLLRRLEDDYNGDLDQFSGLFLEPAKDLLTSLLERVQGVYDIPSSLPVLPPAPPPLLPTSPLLCPVHAPPLPAGLTPDHRRGWPLSHRDRILIHLNDLDHEALSEGDSYFLVTTRQPPPGESSGSDQDQVDDSGSEPKQDIVPGSTNDQETCGFQQDPITERVDAQDSLCVTSQEFNSPSGFVEELNSPSGSVEEQDFCGGLTRLPDIFDYRETSEESDEVVSEVIVHQALVHKEDTDSPLSDEFVYDTEGATSAADVNSSHKSKSECDTCKSVKFASPLVTLALSESSSELADWSSESPSSVTSPLISPVTSPPISRLASPLCFSPVTSPLLPSSPVTSHRPEDEPLVCLVLRFMKDGTVRELPIWETAYENLFMMDFVQNVNTANADDLSALLSHCLVAAQKGLERMSWDSLRLTAHRSLVPHPPVTIDTGQYHDSNVPVYVGPSKDYINNATDNRLTVTDNRNNAEDYRNNGVDNVDNTSMVHRTSNMHIHNTPHRSRGPRPTAVYQNGHKEVREAKAVYRKASDGTLVKEETHRPQVVVETPVRIEELHTDGLRSGVAILSGCKDVRGGAVVVILCKHQAWQLESFDSVQLAKVLLYYHTLPREELRQKGMTVIVDARGTTLPVLNALLETLYTVHASVPGALYIVHVLADRVAQSLLFRSSVFRPQVKLKIDLVMRVDALFKFVHRDQLPVALGGAFPEHCHPTWVFFRQKLDPFLRQCQAVAELLVTVMQDLASTDGLPASEAEARALLGQHEVHVARGLQDAAVVQLQETGQNTLQVMQQLGAQLYLHDDYRVSLATGERLYAQVQDTTLQLMQLADARQLRLEQSAQLRQFEERAAQVVQWLSTTGEDLLEKYTSTAENLKGIRVQGKEFDKAYYSAMTQLEKGSDILDEATTLQSSNTFTAVPNSGIQNVSSELKTRMTSFNTRLEDVRDRIDHTSKCYHLLDKAYEWALEAMQYVSTMKMEKNMTTEDIAKLLQSLDIYLQEHPQVATETFETMLDLAKRLDNDKLYEQCKVARTRCLETDQLLQVRQVTLKRAKDQMEQETVKSCSVAEAQDVSVSTSDLSHQRAHCCGNMGSNVPCMCGSPQCQAAEQHMGMLRRRSYAGKPSAPIYSPNAAAFKENMRDMNFWEYEEYLFNEGLITEDMSDRIVAFLPKGLSDSTMRGSRESLRGSMENLVSGSSENLNKNVISTQTGPDSPPTPQGASVSNMTQCSQSSGPSQSTLNKHSRPHRKMLKKSTSCWIPDSGAAAEMRLGEMPPPPMYTPHHRRSSLAKTLSMVSGSNESLPSMPEEEEDDAGISARISSQTSPQSPTSPSPTPDLVDRPKFGWSPVPVNTHLMSGRGGRSSLPAYQSMADLRVTEAEMKKKKTLSLIMQEMVQTERDYVSALRFIVDNYIPEIAKEDVPPPMRGKRNIIFGNIEKIHEFHSRYFLRELEQCEAQPYRLCQCFLNHEHEFYLYALYNKNKPKSDGLMSDYGMSYFRRKQLELGDRMDLNSYLLKPVQRMGKYALLLKQIIQECPETDPDYNDLKAALEMVKFQLRHGNDLLAMDCLKECDVNLQEQGMLLRQDEFLVWQGRKKCLRHVFLFEDMVLFSKTRRTATGQDVYIYKNSIKTSEMGLTEAVTGSEYKFSVWFRKRTSNETFTLQAPTMDVKHTWVHEVSRLLWKQAIRNREMRLAEMARMGMGSKPCLDLKPSKDNINDRFVNISLSSRVPRMRNSIAVSTFDHMKNGSKRPHSLISLSSTSSSSSKESSNYGATYGFVGVPMEMGSATSPDGIMSRQCVRAKSATIGSEESGIVLDYATPGSPVTEDAYTQTTLKRPIKRTDSGAPTESSSISLTLSDPTADRLSTDV